MVCSLRMALAAVCMTLTSMGGCKSELKIQQGDELYSILEEAVLEVSLRGPTRRADARRFRPEQPLRFSFEEEGRAALESCGPSPELTAALAHLLEIRVRRVLSAPQSKTFLAAHNSELWSVLEIRSIMSSVDPFRLHLLMDAKGSPLYARLPADPQVFTVDESELALLSAHCPPSP
jgi:hypothetical protein